MKLWLLWKESSFNMDEVAHTLTYTHSHTHSHSHSHSHTHKVFPVTIIGSEISWIEKTGSPLSRTGSGVHTQRLWVWESWLPWCVIRLDINSAGHIDPQIYSLCHQHYVRNGELWRSHLININFDNPNPIKFCMSFMSDIKLFKDFCCRRSVRLQESLWKG